MIKDTVKMIREISYYIVKYNLLMNVLELLRQSSVLNDPSADFVLKKHFLFIHFKKKDVLLNIFVENIVFFIIL